MSIEAECPACKHNFIRPDGLAGKQEKCPQCRHVFRLPTRQTEKPRSGPSPALAPPSLRGQRAPGSGGRSPRSIANALVLVLPPALDNARSVQSMAKALGFSEGVVRVFRGPAEVTRGRAEALLCRMDGEDGTSLLDSPFRFGTDLQNGERYGYIIVGSKAPPGQKGDKEASQFSQQLSVGMTMKEVQEILGPPSYQLGDGNALGMYGKVSVIRSPDTPSSMGQKSYVTWRKPEGYYQLVFVGDRLVEIHSTP